MRCKGPWNSSKASELKNQIQTHGDLLGEGGGGGGGGGYWKKENGNYYLALREYVYIHIYIYCRFFLSGYFMDMGSMNRDVYTELQEGPLCPLCGNPSQAPNIGSSSYEP